MVSNTQPLALKQHMHALKQHIHALTQPMRTLKQHRHATFLNINKSCLVTCLGLKRTIKVDFLNSNTCFCSRLYVTFVSPDLKLHNWYCAFFLHSSANLTA